MVVVFLELSTEEEEEEEGDDEDGSSDEFTDSIEEDDDKVTARSLASIQVKETLMFTSSFTICSLRFVLILSSSSLFFPPSRVLRNELGRNFMLCLNSVKACGPEILTRDPVRGCVSQRADVKQLEEEKKSLEGQLEEIGAQLERDGYTSVAQMRSDLLFKQNVYSYIMRKCKQLHLLIFCCPIPGAHCRGCSRRTKP